MAWKRSRSMLHAALAGAAVLSVAACQTSEPTPDYDGRNLYLGYCASCHGTDGAGNGPVSTFIKPPDLRTLSERHGGFPESWLFDVIDGRPLRAAHGTADMPVWGWQFRLVEESATHADARIQALVGYLEQIQTSP